MNTVIKAIPEESSIINQHVLKGPLKLLFVIISLIIILHSFSAQSFAAENECNITLAGDVMLGRNIDRLYSKKPADSVWGTTLHILKSSDLTLINHEFALTNSNNKEEKTFNFKASPKRAASLKVAGIDFANIANNHSLDYGIKGLANTIKTLEKNKIAFAGAGMNNEQAERPAILTCGKYKIGIISLTNNMPEWVAQKDKPGVFYKQINQKSAKELIPLVKNLKQQVDFVIMSTHWGRNWDSSPPEDFRTFAHTLMDAGVDIWHGHSGHIIQGIEIYNNKPIFYCMGDLIDDYKVEPARNDLGYLAHITIKDNHISQTKIIPTAIKNFKATLATDNDFLWVANQLQKLSNNFGTKLNNSAGALYLP